MLILCFIFNSREYDNFSGIVLLLLFNKIIVTTWHTSTLSIAQSQQQKMKAKRTFELHDPVIGSRFQLHFKLASLSQKMKTSREQNQFSHCN